jgi:D-alanyl-D-alanine carboxypeptidase/D-alanyl-D-alanine-endopeptidase (penicillin-binding protein 4)
LPHIRPTGSRVGSDRSAGSVPQTAKNGGVSGLRVRRILLAFAVAALAVGLSAPAAASRAVRGSPPACGPAHYRVRAGDTLWSIARRFNVTVQKLAKANSLDIRAALWVGTDLSIPRFNCAPASRAAPARTSTRKSTTLSRALAGAVATPGVSRSQTGVVVVDLDADQVVYRLNDELPLEPASTEKLPLATAALLRLGSNFRTSTDVLGEGRLVGTAWRGSLVLKGYGDPALTTSGLRALAHSVRKHGITAVTGRVLGDESFFDDARTAPGWKPEFAKNESPLISSLVVDRGLLDGASVDHPALAAAVLFTRALRAEGVWIGHDPGVGRASSQAIRITRRTSPRLITLLADMDTWSDNFIAEMLIKQLGARVAGHGTTAAGARVVARTLAENEVPLGGVRLADGSGLSMLDRLTARTLAGTLETIAHTPSLRRLLATFAVAGATGTLRHRLIGVPDHQLVRGKTGTTDHSSALTGFVGSRFAFAILSNGSPVNWTAAHLLQDRVVEALLAELR